MFALLVLLVCTCENRGWVWAFLQPISDPQKVSLFVTSKDSKGPLRIEQSLEAISSRYKDPHKAKVCLCVSCRLQLKLDYSSSFDSLNYRGNGIIYIELSQSAGELN